MQPSEASMPSRPDSVKVPTTCAVCENSFTCPKVLPCDHVFCQQCLAPTPGTDSGSVWLQCRLCQFRLRLDGEEDASSLPDAQHVVQALTRQTQDSVEQMRVQLQDVLPKLELSLTKLDALLTKMDQMESEQVAQIRKAKEAAQKCVQAEADKIKQLQLKAGSLIATARSPDADDQFCSLMAQIRGCLAASWETSRGFQIRRGHLAAATYEDTTFRELSSFRRHRIGDPLHHRPTCAALCPWSSDIYVCVPDRKVVLVKDGSGKTKQVLAQGFDRPVKVDFSLKNSTIYVLDEYRNGLCVLTGDRELTATWLLGAGHAVGKVRNPCGMVVHTLTGDILIADTGNNRVQVVSRTGEFIRLIGGSCRKDTNGRLRMTHTELNQPEDVALHPEEMLVVVADTGNHRIRLYSLIGEPILVIGMKGSGSGQINLPTSVIWVKSWILVAESGNQRLQLFEAATGKVLGILSSFKGVTSIRKDQNSLLIMTEDKTNSVFRLL